MGNPKIGSRVIIKGSHPWSGHCGVYVRNERIVTLGETHSVVELDNGFSCFVIPPGARMVAVKDA